MNVKKRRTGKNKDMIEVLTNEIALDKDEELAIKAAAESALCYENRSGDLTVLIDSPENIRKLNRDFRHIDRVTDVLTFPSWEGEDPLSGDGYLGDIMICFERAREQSYEYGHSLTRELAFLTVHGVLHLLGYDHMTSDEETVMRSKQTEILNRMGLSI